MEWWSSEKEKTKQQLFITPVLQYSLTPGFACLKAESQKRNPL
jgi:hypothetical protein